MRLGVPPFHPEVHWIFHSIFIIQCKRCHDSTTVHKPVTTGNCSFSKVLATSIELSSSHPVGFSKRLRSFLFNLSSGIPSSQHRDLGYLSDVLRQPLRCFFLLCLSFRLAFTGVPEADRLVYTSMVGVCPFLYRRFNDIRLCFFISSEGCIVLSVVCCGEIIDEDLGFRW